MIPNATNDQNTVIEEGILTSNELTAGESSDLLPATISWIPIDPNDPLATTSYPSFRHASPIRCRIQEGEILYIPAMWYHRVSQTTLTIAVTYWLEQRFDFRYNAMHIIYAVVRTYVTYDGVIV